jgi:mannose-6-phosphate isomerase
VKTDLLGAQLDNCGPAAELYPLTFHPILKERVWGGRRLEQLYGKPLPSNRPFGESWEITDRPGDVSIVDNGPLAGHDLHWLVQNHARALLGSAPLHEGRFPLLIKILDAQEKLSLQVHPPAAKAASLGGEPKTEMWYVTAAQPGAMLYVGLKRGVTRAEFEREVQAGNVADCFHQVPVAAGDVMFLPSGRVHAIGAGLVIFEIQQNSDTTYRVFDWNRTGLDGRPRELHVAQSVESIDFGDFEPALVAGQGAASAVEECRQLVDHALFSVEANRLAAGTVKRLEPDQMQIVGVVSGRLEVRSGKASVSLGAGRFCLVPACLREVSVLCSAAADYLRVTAGSGVGPAVAAGSRADV